MLYEALAGVPAFMGATPQAVVAQRITHEPRPVTVFRPSVPAELEAVLVKALAMAPADRYQTADELAGALPRDRRRPKRVSARPRRQPRRRRQFVVGAVTAALAATLTITARQQGWLAVFSRGVPLDTTRIAILPFAGPALPDSTRAEDLLFEGLRHWRGLRPVEGFEMGDALRRGPVPHTIAEGRTFSRRLGAGRFVQGELGTIEGKCIIRVALFDTRSGNALHEQRFVVPAESAGDLAVYRRIGDALVLLGRGGTTTLDTASSSVSLPAIQVMIRAQDAMREWNLPAAESLYIRRRLNSIRHRHARRCGSHSFASGKTNREPGTPISCGRR